MYGMPPQGPAANSRRGTRLIIIGGVIFAIGVVITVATYAAAADNPAGGTYFVMYGPMIGGLIAVVQGVIDLTRNRGGNRARADWYADPQDPRFERYWDGRTWTEHVRPPAP